MIELSITSSEKPKQSWQVKFNEVDLDKFEIWEASFGMLRDMLFEIHTGKSPVTGLLEKFERKNAKKE